MTDEPPKTAKELGWFPAPEDVQPGRWYLCATCLTCQQAIPVMQIHPQMPIAGDHSFRLRVPCPYCGAVHHYDPQLMSRLEGSAVVSRRGPE